MSTANINPEQMEEYLSRFGESYHAPIYMTMTDLSGFFGSNRNIRWGYAALSDDNRKLFVVVMSLMSMISENSIGFHTISRDDVQSINISKILLTKGHTADIKFTEEGKKKRYKIILGANANGVIPDQESNSQEILDILHTW